MPKASKKVAPAPEIPEEPTLSKVELLRKQLAEAEEAEKQAEKEKANEKRIAIENQAKAMDIKALRAYFIETEMKKRPSATKKSGGAKKAEKVPCACAQWWCNKDKDKIGRSGYNDVKRCGGNAQHEATLPDGTKCMVCDKHNGELIIKHGNPHHGWYELPWDFPEEMLGSKTKREWVKAIWELYPTYRPENYEELLKTAGVA